MNCKELRDVAESLFTKRLGLVSLWQEAADNFYPERADFTVRRWLGDDFASNLTTSYPILCRRDLGDQIGQMLRPTQKPWFHMEPTDNRREDHAARQWLEWAEGLQRRAMYDPHTLFNRATKEGDHDFACFGQAVITVRLNRDRDGLLYRCWHLRDVVWAENDEGQISMVFRKWKPSARDLVQRFKSVSDKVTRLCEKTPLETINCMHMVVGEDQYDGNAKGRKWWSIYYDVDNMHIMEELPVWTNEYVIPRWQTVSGSQYSYSPATVAALPDARLLQSMTYTLLEAGEKITNPPMVATEQAVRSDVSIYAGGITWVDYEYDERLGEALRPMSLSAAGMPIGVDMQNDCRRLLAQAFFLNKLSLPQRAPEMTAYEVGQRIQQYIRDALPIFEPMESDYNGQICERTFDVLLREGAFGPPQDMPKSLRGVEIQFRFASPLHDAIEEMKGQKFMEMKGLIAEAMALDKSVVAIPDTKLALRDAMAGVGIPARWTRSEIVVAEMDRIQAEQEQAQQILATMQQGADVARTVGEAASMAPPMTEQMAPA